MRLYRKILGAYSAPFLFCPGVDVRENNLTFYEENITNMNTERWFLT